jgi:5-bromo-4-chloroindolyl phosphate hydrolysis protein
MPTESQREREVRAARNQSLFRAVNEKLRELNQAFSDVTETYVIACECADTTCVETLHIVMETYIEVREHPSRFVVLADHVFPDVERVVARNDGYAVVENNTSVSEITEATDPSRE